MGGAHVVSQSLCVNSYNRWALGQVVTFFYYTGLWLCKCSTVASQGVLLSTVTGIGGQNLHWLLYDIIA